MAAQVWAAAGGDPAQAPVTAGAPSRFRPSQSTAQTTHTDSAVIQQNTTFLPSPAGGSHCANAPPPQDLLPGGGGDPGGPTTLRAPSVSPWVSFPLLFSSFQSFTCNRLPETTAFSLLFSFSFFFFFKPPFYEVQGWDEQELVMSLVGTGAPPVAAPLVLRHAALRRLALPNFCLKLNLKEKKKQKTRNKESRISFLLDFSSSARGAGGGGRVRDERKMLLPRPPTCMSPRGPGHQLRSKTSCSFFP